MSFLGERLNNKAKVELLEKPKVSTRIILFGGLIKREVFELDEFGGKTVKEVLEACTSQEIYGVQIYEHIDVPANIEGHGIVSLRSDAINITGIGYFDGVVSEVSSLLKSRSVGRWECKRLKEIAYISDKAVLDRKGIYHPFLKDDFVISTIKSDDLATS